MSFLFKVHLSLIHFRDCYSKKEEFSERRNKDSSIEFDWMKLKKKKTTKNEINVTSCEIF
jgi:hypothetical protein